MLFAFEDNEAVIEIIKGRNPTMRHVSRTHRVALEWLFDRINLDSVIQIRYIDTKHQFADILTKGNFTRDEWNNLLHLFTNSHVSSICCAKKSRLISCAKTMAKRMQDKKKRKELWQNRNLQRWTCLHMFRDVRHPQKVRLHPKVRETHSYWEIWKQDEQNSKSHAASSSQARLQDAYLGGWTRQRRNLSQQKRSQGMWTFPNLKLGAFTKKKWRGDRLLMKQLRRNPMHQ